MHKLLPGLIATSFLSFAGVSVAETFVCETSGIVNNQDIVCIQNYAIPSTPTRMIIRTDFTMDAQLTLLHDSGDSAYATTRSKLALEVVRADSYQFHKLDSAIATVGLTTAMADPGRRIQTSGRDSVNKEIVITDPDVIALFTSGTPSFKTKQAFTSQTSSAGNAGIVKKATSDIRITINFD